jgi:hypothetical protein
LQRAERHKALQLEEIMHQRLRPISARRINMAEPYEVTYWSKVFGVSEDDLALTVSEVGEDIDRVRQALAKHRKGPDGHRRLSVA